MDYQEIMRDIASGLTGENEKDIQYLMEQMEKYKDHELGKEIIRACGRLISGMLPKEKVNEFADAFEKDNAEIENEMTGQLKENITIESVTVNTFGQDFKVIKNDNN